MLYASYHRRLFAQRRRRPEGGGSPAPGKMGTAMTLTSLLDDLPPPAADGGPTDPDAVFEAFAGWAKERGFDLYPHQEEALFEIVTGANVILSTPTGSGKSLVAAGAHFTALADGRRTFYTAPIKALVSEKFFDLCETFGTANVGMMTGDAAVNADAPIVCCTAEVLANIALRDGPDSAAGQVVMDEFHFYADPDRGWAWQVPLLELPRAQFLLMSATLGDVSRFEADLTRRTGRPTAVVRSAVRPVPLFYAYRTTPMHETLQDLLATRQAPVYVVHFTQAAAVERASALMSVNVSTRAEKDAIAAEIGDFRFTTAFGKNLSRFVRHGIGVHHAGMLPKYRRLVERLAQAGLLKVVCGTDTLGVGVNVPIRTVLFTGLSKYDGQRTRLLTAREFHQIAGRAGDFFAAMRHLLEDNHSDRPTQRRLIREAIAIYRSLLAAGVLERLSAPDSEGRTVRLTVDLQDDFALNQPLSTLALAAIDLLDRESPTYALDVVSVIESTLDDPRQVLSAQQHKARGEAVAAMKAEGIENDERMERLPRGTWPKPLEELLHAAYEAYRRGHPWVADHALSPKSVVRDLSEQAMTFADFVNHYQLARSEGVVLRYLAGAFKALAQTVPAE